MNLLFTFPHSLWPFLVWIFFCAHAVFHSITLQPLTISHNTVGTHQTWTTHSPNCKTVKPSYCLSGGAPHPFSQPHQRSEQPGQRPSAAMSSVCSSACKAQLRFTQNYLPLSLPSGLPTQVPPSPEHQWYLPLLIQLLTYKHQNLLQDQERWVKRKVAPFRMNTQVVVGVKLRAWLL